MAGTATTRFLTPGNDSTATVSIREICMARPDVITSLCVEIDGPAGAGAQILTYTVMVNGVATAVSVPVVVTGTQGLIIGVAASVVAGDRVGLRVTKSGGHPAITDIHALVGYG